MDTVEINLSVPQHKKLLSGLPVMVKHSSIGSGPSIHLGKMNYSKLESHYHKGKGAMLQLTATELKKNSSLSGGKFSIGKAIKKGKQAVKKGRQISNTVAKTSDKINKNIQKTDKVIQKVDKIVDKGEIIGQLGIPYVSAGYNALDLATDAAAEASGETAKHSKKINKHVQSGNKIIQGNYDSQKSVYDQNATGNANEKRYGSGVNPYLPKQLQGGSFRARSGGSFRTGGSFRVNGEGVKLDTTETTIMKPTHNSWNPIQEKTLHKCKHCGM